MPDGNRASKPKSERGGKMMRNANIRLMSLSVVVASALWYANAQPTLYWIYDPDDRDTRHRVWGYSVTKDGRYVVGSCITGWENYDPDRKYPFLWDRQNQSFNISFADCNTVGVEARDVAYVNGDYGPNDLTIVGGYPSAASTPFVWSQNRGCHPVNFANIGFAYSLSEDYLFAGVDRYGPNPIAVIWGSSYPRPGLYRKVLQSGPSEALAIAKQNSSIVVGWARNAAGRNQAVVWKHTGVRDASPTQQYFLPYPSDWSSLTGSAAVAISSDGRIILGNGSGQIIGDEFIAPVVAIFIWRWDGANSGTITLEEIPTSPVIFEASTALAISDDGRTIVGYRNYPDTNRQVSPRAARWRKTGSRWVYEDLNQTYSNLLRDGSVLRVAQAISPDGRYIVGWGYNATRRRQEAFLLDTGPCTVHDGDVNNDGCISDADLLQVLFAFGSTGSNLGRVDVNCDGIVDDADLILVLINFGRC
jgi:uncharacterized membrane protein